MTAKTWHFATIALVMTTLVAGRAWGQAERVLHFAHTDGRESMNEISAVIATISEVRRSLDDSEGTLKIDGTPDQIALAEWLFVQLDQAQAPAANQWDSTVHEYLLKSGGENAVRVLFLRNTATVRTFRKSRSRFGALPRYAGRSPVALQERLRCAELPTRSGWQRGLWTRWICRPVRKRRRASTACR